MSEKDESVDEPIFDEEQEDMEREADLDIGYAEDDFSPEAEE